MSHPPHDVTASATARDSGSAADCYSAGDRRMMEWWKRLRAEQLTPFLATLGRAGATADRVTLLGLAFGLGFCALWSLSPMWAMLSLFLHVALDGLDGPLARQQGTASRRGSFTDTLCDQLVVAGTTITLMVAGLLDPALALLYVFLYTVVVTFSMVRNALGVPYGWLLRPRFPVYLAIPVDVWLWPGATQWVVIASLPFLAFAVFRGAYRLRARL